MITILRRKLIDAQKNKEELVASTLKLLISEFQKREIELRALSKEFTDEDGFKIFRKQIKNRMDSIPMYEKAGRIETAEKEKAEIRIIQDLAKEILPSFDLTIGGDPRKNA